MTSAAAIDPGPLAPPERVRPACDEALALLNAIYPLNLSRAADLIRDNPPSADAVAMLAFIAHDVLTRLTNQANARHEHPNSRAARIRDLGLEGLADAKKRAPELLPKSGGRAFERAARRLTKQISKVKAAR